MSHGTEITTITFTVVAHSALVISLGCVNVVISGYLKNVHLGKNCSPFQCVPDDGVTQKSPPSGLTAETAHSTGQGDSFVEAVCDYFTLMCDMIGSIRSTGCSCAFVSTNFSPQLYSNDHIHCHTTVLHFISSVLFQMNLRFYPLFIRYIKIRPVIFAGLFHLCSIPCSFRAGLEHLCSKVSANRCFFHSAVHQFGLCSHGGDQSVK